MWALAAPALDVNMATEADLDSLRGFGPATTARVLAEREKGPFTSWADLMARVKGLRAATATKLSAQGLTVNGQAYPDASGATLPTDTPQ
ncbi:MAG: helix-hairpin-helix domain-containing protein [Burkholderiales bacterium]|nr:helix-hairpin-helix domain-containing protein [Burkholderiales bacterium]